MGKLKSAHANGTEKEKENGNVWEKKILTESLIVAVANMMEAYDELSIFSVQFDQW